MRLPSAICTGACSHLSMYSSTHGQSVCLRTARISRSLSILLEEGLDIEIEHPVVPPAPLPRNAESIERRFAGPVSVGVVVEMWFHKRFQKPFDHHLGDAVGDRGNAQRPGPTIVLRYVYPSAAESSSPRTADSRACRGCS